jgi:hypothetical protein
MDFFIKIVYSDGNLDTCNFLDFQAYSEPNLSLEILLQNFMLERGEGERD